MLFVVPCPPYYCPLLPSLLPEVVTKFEKPKTSRLPSVARHAFSCLLRTCAVRAFVPCAMCCVAQGRYPSQRLFDSAPHRPAARRGSSVCACPAALCSAAPLSAAVLALLCKIEGCCSAVHVLSSCCHACARHLAGGSFGLALRRRRATVFEYVDTGFHWHRI